MPTIVPVLLAGGKGERLRPLSGDGCPKQFLKLLDNNTTLFQATVHRALSCAPLSQVITVASQYDAMLVTQQLSLFDENACNHVLLEPFAKNTAAAAMAAALHAVKHFEDPILWLMPCDHYIADPQMLLCAVTHAAHQAERGNIVCFGITPTQPNNQYGHIIYGDVITMGGAALHKVDRFVEKPQGAILNELMQQKQCLWNSGMFLVSATSLLFDMKRDAKEIAMHVTQSYEKAMLTEQGTALNKDAYHAIEAKPIDKAIIEKSDRLLVAPIDIGWSDVGSWFSLWQMSQQDAGSTSLEKFLKKIRGARSNVIAPSLKDSA